MARVAAAPPEAGAAPPRPAVVPHGGREKVSAPRECRDVLAARPAAPARVNAPRGLFLTALHLVLFYENRLQDHHLVIPSVLQGLRALVSSCPTARGWLQGVLGVQLTGAS